MNPSFKLYRLQQIDSHLDRANARSQEIERILSQDEALREAGARAESASQALQQVQKSLRRAEEETRAQRLKIEQTEATLYSGKVRNPKELQDLQHESEALRRYRNVLEDRQLEAMIAVEEAEAAHTLALAELEKVRTQHEQLHQKLAEERASLQAEVERLKSERLAAASSITPQEISLYEQLRQQRNGIAVAKVTDKACSACGSTLSAALLHAARSPSQITRCNICGRILYGG